MIEKEGPKLEYNLAGGLLTTVREEDFSHLCEEVFNSGFRYGCVLPFRALTKEGGIESLQDSPLQIIHLEKAWNPTDEDVFKKALVAGLRGRLKRTFGDKTEPPIVKDALFPSKGTCSQLFNELMIAFPKAKFISYKVLSNYDSDRWLLGISSGIRMQPEEILAGAVGKGVGLVFDPSHLLNPRSISLPETPTKQAASEWERQFRFFSRQVEVVDINPPRKRDVVDLLLGRGLLKELALVAKEAEVNYLRVEIPLPLVPQLPGSSLGFGLLKAIGQRLQES